MTRKNTARLMVFVLAIATITMAASFPPLH